MGDRLSGLGARWMGKYSVSAGRVESNHRARQNLRHNARRRQRTDDESKVALLHDRVSGILRILSDTRCVVLIFYLPRRRPGPCSLELHLFESQRPSRALFASSIFLARITGE